MRQYLPVFLLAFLWAAYGPILRFFDEIKVGFLEINFIAFSIGTLALFALFSVQKTNLVFPTKIEAKKLLLYALGLCSANVLLYYAFNLTTLANTILLHYTGLFWGSAFAVVFLGEKFTRWKLISCALATIGILVIFLLSASLSEKYFVGNLFALASSFGYAAIILASRMLKESEPKKTSFYATLFCALIFAPFFFVFGQPLSVFQFASLAVYGATYAPLEAIFVIFGMTGVGVIAASIILVLEIPVTALIGFFFYSEELSLQTTIGGALIVCAVILLILKEKTGKI